MLSLPKCSGVVVSYLIFCHSSPFSLLFHSHWLLNRSLYMPPTLPLERFWLPIPSIWSTQVILGRPGCLPHSMWSLLRGYRAFFKSPYCPSYLALCPNLFLYSTEYLIGVKHLKSQNLKSNVVQIPKLLSTEITAQVGSSTPNIMCWDTVGYRPKVQALTRLSHEDHLRVGVWGQPWKHSKIPHVF